ncbi:MAG: hypothetical protein EA409_13445 [Saprospirales bacterium]|nr:MAG: hypothetical protein EA409_13445 [Saprospirales bacterium]
MKLQNSFFLVLAITIVCGVTFSSCSKDDDGSVSVLEEGKKRYEELKKNPDLIEVSFPDVDPGPPFYARVGKFPDAELVFRSKGKVFIPILRGVSCIDKEFNLLDLAHVPNAFFCQLTITGTILIEADAQPGDFPAIGFGQGENVDMWILDEDKFDNAIADGVLTIGELESLQPLMGKGSYAEYNVPRDELGYLLLIEASGTVASTNQKFSFSYVERNRQQVSISLDLK